MDESRSFADARLCVTFLQPEIWSCETTTIADNEEVLKIQREGRFPIENPGKPGKLWIWGLGGAGGGVFTANIMKRLAQ